MSHIIAAHRQPTIGSRLLMHYGLSLTFWSALRSTCTPRTDWRLIIFSITGLQSQRHCVRWQCERKNKIQCNVFAQLQVDAPWRHKRRTTYSIRRVSFCFASIQFNSSFARALSLTRSSCVCSAEYVLAFHFHLCFIFIRRRGCPGPIWE